MNSSDDKDYFEYKEGKIVYNETFFKKLKIIIKAIRINRKLPNKDTFANLFSRSDLEKTRFSSLFKKPQLLLYPLTLIVTIFTIGIVLHSQSDVTITPLKNTHQSSVSDQKMDVLKNLEISEFKLIESYLSNSTSSLYTKETLLKIISDKENLISNKQILSEDTLEIFNNSIEHSLEVLEALKNHNPNLVQQIHKAYFVQHS